MMTNTVFVVCVLMVALMAAVAQSTWVACPNDCSHRGLCVNGACICAEGLTGSDCSQGIVSSLPTLYQCPQCYSVTVGPAQYISGPSWRLPDGPIAGLNYRGNLSVYMGNGDGEMISSGTYFDDYLPSPIIALSAGTVPNFDSCGSWMLRAITTDSGNVAGFYHAEKNCTYTGAGQTRKSGGVSYSTDGGKSFQKPNYPNNKILDTNTPVLVGLPSGEGDFSIVMKGDYYYMFFQNVEDYHIGMARADRSSDANPGSFYKYNAGTWTQPALGGTSSKIYNMAGTQAYLHTPSQSFVAVGNNHPYWNQGAMMSTSDDGINWTYFSDPIFTPDPVTNTDQIMYSSFLGPTGGYDIGSTFKFYYMWIQPFSNWTRRYQIAKDVTLTYVGPNSTLPLSKIALTTYRSASSGETWQSTELADSPYNAVGIVGYLMSRAYPNTFVVYDCFNFNTGDHFVGVADECFFGTGVGVVRTLGYLWSVRVAQSIAVYRCKNGIDTFLSSNTNCDGLAPAQTTPFGFMQDGPAFNLASQTVIFQGSSWKYNNFSAVALPASWNTLGYDDSAWGTGACPFGRSYATAISYFGPTPYYFRYKFQVPAGKTVTKLFVSVASDDFASIWLNGALVDVDPASGHEASYWNRRVYLNVASIVSGTNVLAVRTQNYDNWAYFDLQLVASYATSSKRSISEEVGIHDMEAREEAELNEVEAREEVAIEMEVTEDAPASQKATRDTAATVLPRGSQWRYWNVSVPAVSWSTTTFVDSAWPVGQSPFVTGYSAWQGNPNVTAFLNKDYYFRSQFTLPAQTVTSMTVSVASDNTAIVWVNNVLVDTDPASWHQATYWNRVITINTATLVSGGTNTIAILTKNADSWAFFDCEITATFAAAVAPTSAPATAAPVTGGSTSLLVPRGSAWKYSTSAPAATWIQNVFDDSQWSSAAAPFANNYGAFSSSIGSYSGGGSFFGNVNYYFRYSFNVPAGSTITSLSVGVASDNNCNVYINGQLVQQDPVTWHPAAYWNLQSTFAPTMLVTGTNTITVLANNNDQWAFFDLELSAQYGGAAPTSAPLKATAAPVAPTAAPVAPTAAPVAPTVAPTQAPLGGGMLIPRGSMWSFYNQSQPTGWYQQGFDSSRWMVAKAPFVTGYQYYTGTPFGQANYMFRSTFNIPAGKTVSNFLISLATDTYSTVYINGILVDTDPAYHAATYWNRQVNIYSVSMVVSGTNTIAVEVQNGDAWAFFDMELTVTYAQSGTVQCGIKGQVINGGCVCDFGWGGPTCTTNLCSYTGATNVTAVAAGSTWKNVVGTMPKGWYASGYDDSWWTSSSAPFHTSNYADKTGTLVSYQQKRLYRQGFYLTVPYNSVIQTATLFLASEDVHRVWINGKIIDAPVWPYNPHTGTHWNQVYQVDGSLLQSLNNEVAVEIPLVDNRWFTYFDLQLVVTYSVRTCVQG